MRPPDKELEATRKGEARLSRLLNERAQEAVKHQARAEALDGKLKEAVEVLKMIESIRPMWEGGVRGPSADNLSNTLEHIRAEVRAFLASIGDKGLSLKGGRDVMQRKEDNG